MTEFMKSACAVYNADWLLVRISLLDLTEKMDRFLYKKIVNH